MYCTGVADWVYEEEVLSDTRAIWFSPNGDKVGEGLTTCRLQLKLSIGTILWLIKVFQYVTTLTHKKGFRMQKICPSNSNLLLFDFLKYRIKLKKGTSPLPLSFVS